MPKLKSFGYGFFPGGDPRLFSPDSDSTPEEIENHRATCAAWDAGARNSRPDCEHLGPVVLTSCQFGLGSYEYTEDVPWGYWIAEQFSRLRMRLYWRLPRRAQDWIARRALRKHKAVAP